MSYTTASSMMTSLWSRVSDQGHSANLQGSLVASYQENHLRIQRYNPYVQSAANVALLNDVGINSLDVGVQTHSHPACKALETYILTEDLPSLIKTPATAMFMKQAKAQRLADACGQPVTLDNPILTLKDFTRYPDGTARQPRPVVNPTLVLHDALHNMTAADLIQLFESSPALETAIATVVYPPELLMGATTSAWPTLYTFEVRGNRLLYYPDGKQTESYNQPVDLDWLLRSSRVCSSQVTLSIEMVRSYYSHHVFLISRHQSIVPVSRPFPAPDMVEVPAELMPGVDYTARLVPRVLAKQLVLFALGVSKANQAQIYSRARALVGDFKVQASLQAVMTIVQVACSVLEERPSWSPSVSVLRTMAPSVLKPVFLPHDLWRRLTWKFFEGFCRSLDMAAATNVVELKPYYLRSGRDGLSALFTGVHAEPTFHSILDLAQSIALGEDVGNVSVDDHLLSVRQVCDDLVVPYGGAAMGARGPAVPALHATARSLTTLGLLCLPWFDAYQFVAPCLPSFRPSLLLRAAYSRPRTTLLVCLASGPALRITCRLLAILYESTALAVERFCRHSLSVLQRTAIEHEFTNVAALMLKISALFHTRFGLNSRISSQMINNLAVRGGR